MLKKLFLALLCAVFIISCSTVVFATGNDLELLPADGYDVGDVDMDGKITIGDATSLQRHLARLITLSDEQLELADANFDLEISINDATRIQLHLAGILGIEKPTEPPTEDPDNPIKLPFVPAA